METKLNLGMFEAIDNRDLMEIDGGRPEDYNLGVKIGQAAKTAYNAVSNAVSSAWNWVKNLF